MSLFHINFIHIHTHIRLNSDNLFRYTSYIVPFLSIEDPVLLRPGFYFMIYGIEHNVEEMILDCVVNYRCAVYTGITVYEINV